MRASVLWGILCLFVASQGCQQPPASTIRFPYEWLGPQGIGGDIDQQGIQEPSGICFHPTRKTLFVVSDEGELFEITTDGAPLFDMVIPGDLEGLTVDPNSGLVYILVEGEERILEFDPEERTITRGFTIDRRFGDDPNFLQKQPPGDFDNGCEALAFVPDESHPEGGAFYVANQWDPSCVVEVSVPLRSSSKKEDVATIVRVLTMDLDDPAAMFFDDSTGYLNVVSDGDNILIELTPEGQIVSQYAFVGNDQEGLTRDDKGYLYIAQDCGKIIRVRDLRVAPGGE